MTNVYGIDLGTTFTKCALSEGAKVTVFDLDVDIQEVDKKLPKRLPGLRSAVTVACRGERRVAFVGNRAIRARDQLARQKVPHYPFEESKLWIGTDFALSGSPGAPPWHFDEHDWKYQPEDAGALVLRAVSREVERVGAAPIRRVVITHPAQFNSSQQEATRHAAAIAGIEVVDLLTEPEAAAIAYSRELKEDGLYLIYDLGGGTLDLVLLEIKNRQLHSIGKNGMKLGGRDFDRVILDMMIAECANYTSDVFNADMLSEEGRQLWLAHAERIKRRLNESSLGPDHRERFVIPIDSQYPREAGMLPGGDLQPQFEVRFSRAELDERMMGLLDESRDLVAETLKNAGITSEKVKGIISVGGSTKMLAVAALLDELSGGRVHRSLDPDTVVAQGAAIHGAAIENRGVQGVAVDELIKRTPYRGSLYRTVGIKIFGSDGTPRIVPLVRKGTPTPLDKPVEKDFTTSVKGQDHIQIQLYEGESPDPDDGENNFIGECRLDGFAPTDQFQKVTVGMQIEGNDTKRIIATIGGKALEKEIDFDPAKVLARDKVQERAKFIESLTILDD